MQRHIYNFYFWRAFLQDNFTIFPMAKPFTVIQKQSVFQRASMDPTCFCVLRGRKKSAVYHTKNHFIILRWKLPSSFSGTVKKESLVGRESNDPFLKSSANWCLPTNRKSQWCGLQTLNLESGHWPLASPLMCPCTSHLCTVGLSFLKYRMGIIKQFFKYWIKHYMWMKNLLLTFKALLRASLVAQWWRICLLVQETWVQSLCQEDPWEGNGNSLRYSRLGNPIHRGAWRATVHGITKSRTPLSN